MKWWSKLFWLIEASVVNSYFLMKIYLAAEGIKGPIHLSYRRKLIELW